MPIVHRHSLDSQQLAANLDLAVHAVHHHSHDIGHGDSGWHVHFVWPSADGKDAADEEDQPAPSLAWPCVLVESPRGACADEMLLAQFTVGDLAIESLVSLTGTVWAAKPLPRPELKSKRISPHAALCVARC